MATTETSPIPNEMAFPQAEYDRRIAAARAAMDRDRLDLLLVHSLPNICYLTGFQTPLADWYHCLILPRQGAPVLQLCDTELAQMHTAIGTMHTVLWEQMDAAADQLVALLGTLGAHGARIGIETRRPGLNPFTDHHLRGALSQARFVDATDLVLKVRAVKSPAEIACLREAARLSSLGMEAAIGAIRPGATENDICAAAMHAIVRAGGEYFCIDPIVRAGPRSGVTHATAKRGAIRPGDAVLMEFGAVFQRYCAPLLRTAVIGTPSPALRRLCDTSLRAMDLLYQHLRPGRPMGEVARAATKALADIEPTVKMRGYFGYAVGIGFPPSWVERSVEIAEGRQELLQPGMTFHTHRSMRVPGVMGVGFSETIVITDAGFEILTSHPRRLAIL